MTTTTQAKYRMPALAIAAMLAIVALAVAIAIAMTVNPETVELAPMMFTQAADKAATA